MADLIREMPIPYEPKRKNRWVLNLIDNKNDIHEWVISKTSRPKFVKKGFFVKQFQVEPMRVELRDPICPSTSQVLYQVLLEDKPLDFTLEMLDPTGVVVEKWNLTQCMLLEVDFGELDYAKDELATCSIVFKPEIADLIY